MEAISQLLREEEDPLADSDLQSLQQKNFPTISARNATKIRPRPARPRHRAVRFQRELTAPHQRSRRDDCVAATRLHRTVPTAGPGS